VTIGAMIGMGQLPKFHTGQTQVFAKTGVDYCGLFFLRTIRKKVITLKNNSDK